MIRRILALALGLVLVSVLVAQAEVRFKSLSVTSTSQTYYLPVPAAAVMLCSYGANIAYVRIFDEFDTPAASTTSFTPIPAGTATAPICKSYSKTPTNPANFKAVSIVCTTAETATVTLEFQ